MAGSGRWPSWSHREGADPAARPQLEAVLSVPGRPQGARGPRGAGQRWQVPACGRCVSCEPLARVPELPGQWPRQCSSPVPGHPDRPWMASEWGPTVAVWGVGKGSPSPQSLPGPALLSGSVGDAGSHDVSTSGKKALGPAPPSRPSSSGQAEGPRTRSLTLAPPRGRALIYCVLRGGVGGRSGCFIRSGAHARGHSRRTPHGKQGAFPHAPASRGSVYCGRHGAHPRDCRSRAHPLRLRVHARVLGCSLLGRSGCETVF